MKHRLKNEIPYSELTAKSETSVGSCIMAEFGALNRDK